MSRSSFTLTAFSRLLDVASASASTASRIERGTLMPRDFGSLRCWWDVSFYAWNMKRVEDRMETYADDIDGLVVCFGACSAVSSDVDIAFWNEGVAFWHVVVFKGDLEPGRVRRSMYELEVWRERYIPFRRSSRFHHTVSSPWRRSGLRRLLTWSLPEENCLLSLALNLFSSFESLKVFWWFAVSV
jgi:hypothetical protein